MKDAFEIVHPAFAALYFAAVLVFAMASFQPVVLGLIACAGIAYGFACQGVAAARHLLWQVPLVLVIAVANFLLAGAGSTELFRIGSTAFYLESFVFGAATGLMLLSVFVWFMLAAQVLTSDKVMLLMGRFAPTVGLLITMTMRLVPQFVRRGASISDTRAACTAAGAPKGKLAGPVRQATVLMSWGMEDSLDTADAMKARGWSADTRRTSYARRDFRLFDAAACAILLLLVALCAFCLAVFLGGFAFYPVMGPWGPWWSYAPFALLLCVPVVLEVAR